MLDVDREAEGGLDLLVRVEWLFKADQVRVVSALVRFCSVRCQFNANNGFGIDHVCDRFTMGLGCGW
jgi:hypothetical protein